MWLLLNNHVCCLMRLHAYLGPYHSKTVGTVDSDRELIDVLVNSLRCDPPICKTLSVPCRGKSESVHVKLIYLNVSEKGFNGFLNFSSAKNRTNEFLLKACEPALEECPHITSRRRKRLKQ